MENQEKLDNWLDKVHQGKENYLVLNHSPDGWNFQDEGQQDQLTFLLAAIWRNDKIYLYHKYDAKASIDVGENFLTVVKDKDTDKAKMMIAVKNVGLFSFGMKSGSTEKCEALLFARCDDWLSTIVAATSDPPMVQVQQIVAVGLQKHPADLLA